MTKLLKIKTWDGTERYKNTSLNCKDPLYRNSCKSAGKSGTCALIRKLPNGSTTVVPPDSIDPNKDVCFISPPYVPVKGTINVTNSGSMIGPKPSRAVNPLNNIQLTNSFFKKHNITK